MSASRRPTLAPDSCSDAARLTATVDLPTPPLPEPTAMTCFTPGIAGSRRPLKAARTLAVIFRSTDVTPGRSETSWRAIVWNRSRTGHAGVVSSNVKLTRPSSVMASSLIMPRLTTSRPRSGSLIADRTSKTCSLLGTEDHRGPHREHAEKHEDADDESVHMDPGYRRAAAIGTDPHAPARGDERCGHARDGDRPQRQPQELARERPRDRERDEEDQDQRQLEDAEVAVRLVQPAQAEAGGRMAADQQRDEGGPATEPRSKEEAAERPCVAPHRLVADAQQDARVGRDEETEQRADDGDDKADDPRKEETSPCPAEPRVERRYEREGAEQQQGPCAGRHGRPVVEDRARLARRDVDQHVPEPGPARGQVGGQKDRTDDQQGQGDQVADPRRGLVAHVGRQPEERRDHVRAARQAREEEVEEDVPGPVGSPDEVLRREVDHQGATLRRNATMPATTASTPVTSAPR